LAPELAAEQGFVLRFEREVEIVRRLNHPHIIRFFDSGVHDGRPWFAMEYIAGPSFDAILETRGRLPWREVLDLACQVAPALKHAHDRGVIHRDLKPSNLLRAPPTPALPNARGEAGEGDEDGPGVVKLGDFGVASLFAGRHLTVTGGVVGTAEFLSPEQAAGKRVTARSDLYSFGVVLYTLLVGRPPFMGEIMDLLHKHRYARFDPPIEFAQDMPRDFNDVICDLMEKDPEKRPADGGLLLRRLEAIRRKNVSRSSAPTRDAPRPATPAPGSAASKRGSQGPATLMSRLMRRELDQQNRGGPLARLFNRPMVIVALLAIVIGVLIWTFWPLNKEQLYQRGASAAASSDQDDWDKALEYFDALDRNYPNHPYHKEVDELRRRVADRDAARQAARAARLAGPMSEAQWFFEDGMRLCQRGDADGARRTWKALALAFSQSPEDAPWVSLANKELQRLDEGAALDRQWAPVRAAVQKAKDLRQQGKTDEADAIMNGLRALYLNHNDPEAEAIIKE
ncbi:MAG TPA: protein kinase, partial [Gemmataceae bacterium]|nr:protein kinase [Gemmataceae bacterium]